MLPQTPPPSSHDRLAIEAWLRGEPLSAARREVIDRALIANRDGILVRTYPSSDALAAEVRS